jgi:hypothetical protein
MWELLFALTVGFSGGYLASWATVEPVVVTKLECPKLEYPVVVEDVNGTGCIEVDSGDTCSTSKPRVVLGIDDFLSLSNGLIKRKNDIILCIELINLNNKVNE